jgi:2-dehydro-3-deoxyphosphogluconate aldolase / (4S)-4-hydroxy-2-oxoglutarate aldolase
VARGSIVEEILRVGVVPVVRLDDLTAATKIARSLAEGGIPVLEFTLTNPDAIEAVRSVRTTEPDVITGAGTVLDGASARLAIVAGAQYLVTPTLAPDVIAMGLRYNVPTFCGALTPTEVLAAWEAGAACVKIFPASAFGPGYIKALHGPLPQVRMMPSGGVSVENAGDFIRAGSVAVSAGGDLVSADTVIYEQWDTITQRARAFSQAVRAARSEA